MWMQLKEDLRIEFRLPDYEITDQDSICKVQYNKNIFAYTSAFHEAYT